MVENKSLGPTFRSFVSQQPLMILTNFVVLSPIQLEYLQPFCLNWERTGHLDINCEVSSDCLNVTLSQPPTDISY